MAGVSGSFCLSGISENFKSYVTNLNLNLYVDVIRKENKFEITVIKSEFEAQHTFSSTTRLRHLNKHRP